MAKGDRRYMHKGSVEEISRKRQHEHYPRREPDFTVAAYVDGLVYEDEGYRAAHRQLLEATPLPR